MSIFAEKLRDLMDEKAVDVNFLVQELNLSAPSRVYEWLRGDISLSLTSAVGLANYFDCSLDYLFGRSVEYKRSEFKECPPFYLHLRQVFKEQKVSQYKLKVDKIISGGSLHAWLRLKRTPHIESIIKLANYLNVSMDYLVGREK